MKLLLITYHFWPENTVGADRPNSLFRYASENNIHIDVITASSAESSQKDGSVTRIAGSVGWFEPPYSVLKIINKIATKLIEPFYLNIDRYWVNRVEQYTKSRLHSGMYDAVYVIYPHVHALEAALRVKRYLKVPLISDFTDCIGYFPLEKPNYIQKKTRNNFECKVLCESAAVITIAAGYKQYYNSISSTPAHLIYNGYDENDFADIPDKPRSPVRKDTVRFVHFGNINASRKRNVLPLFEAIARLKDNDQVPYSKISFDFIGRYTREEHGLVNSLGIQDAVNFLPYMEKQKGFNLISNEYDYLIFYGVPEQSSTVCSKLLEYLRLYKPILGICKGNEAEHIIQKAGAGETADFSTPDVERLFLRAIRRDITYRPNKEYIKQFNRQSQAKEIFSVIRSCVNAK